MKHRLHQTFERLLFSVPRVRHLLKQIEQAGRDVEKLKGQLGQATGEVEELKGQLGQAHSRIGKLQEENMTERGKIQELEKKLAAAQSQKIELATRRLDALDKIAALRAQEAELREKYEQLATGRRQEIAELNSRLQAQSELAANWQRLLLEQLNTGAFPGAVDGNHNLHREKPPTRTSHQRMTETAATLPIVSFVCQTRNKQARLSATIESVRKQAVDGLSEIIVGDLGSTDGTKEWLGDQADVKAVVLTHGTKATTSLDTLNVALGAAQGRWICLISDDTILEADCISEAISNSEELDTGEVFVGACAFFERYLPMEDRYYVQHTIGGMLRVGQGLFLREALEDVGFVDTAFADYEEALEDLSLKIWDAGYTITSSTRSFADRLMVEGTAQGNIEYGGESRKGQQLKQRWNGRFASLEFPGFFKEPYREYSDRADSETAREILRTLREK